MSVLIFYKKPDGMFRTLDTATGGISDVVSHEEGVHKFHLFKGYSDSDDELRRFAADFKQWCNELKTDRFPRIDYGYYYCHMGAVTNTFKRLTDKVLFEGFEAVDHIEDRWWNLCNNGGSMFCQPGTYDNCVGYDFKGFYPRILGSEEFKDFKIPTKRGTEKRYKRIPKNILPGIYRVKITSDHPHAPKLFTFSKNDGYTHYSLNHALSLVDKYDFNVEIICDGKPNAYVYAEEDMVVCSSIFGNWLNVLMDKKARFPKNKLVKHLLSSIWGHLSQANVINVSEEKSQDLNVGFLGDDDCDWFLINETHAHDGVYYTLQNAKQPYHHNIRLKPFITSFGRTQVARIIEPYVDHVIRVQTDGVCYNNFDPKFPDSYGIGIEADKSGRIKFVNVNKYEKL